MLVVNVKLKINVKKDVLDVIKKILFVYNMDKALTTFASIMLFYAVLACVVGPVSFYFLWKKSLKTAGNGFVAGSIVSILLCFMYGSKMV